MNNRITKTMRAKAGFTLVELIVVIAILGILAGVGTVGYSGYIKKANEAADNMLLSAVNQAFAAACLENGTDVQSVSSADIELTGTNGTKTVALNSVEPAEYKDAFEKYFAGNAASAFRVFADLDFKPDKHVFEGVTTERIEALTGIINTVQSAVSGSTFEGKEAEVIGDVQALTNAVKAVATSDPNLVGTLLGEGGAFATYLNENNIESTDTQKVANYATLFLADQVSKLNDAQKEKIAEIWTRNNFNYQGGVMDGVMRYTDADTGLSTMGAMALFYANAEACVQNMEKNYNPVDPAAQEQKQAVIEAFKGVSTSMASSTGTEDIWNALASGYSNMINAATGNQELIGVLMNYGSSHGVQDAAAFTNAMNVIDQNAESLKTETDSANMYGRLSEMLGGN